MSPLKTVYVQVEQPSAYLQFFGHIATLNIDVRNAVILSTSSSLKYRLSSLKGLWYKLRKCPIIRTMRQYDTTWTLKTTKNQPQLLQSNNYHLTKRKVNKQPPKPKISK